MTLLSTRYCIALALVGFGVCNLSCAGQSSRAMTSSSESPPHLSMIGSMFIKPSRRLSAANRGFERYS